MWMLSQTVGFAEKRKFFQRGRSDIIELFDGGVKKVTVEEVKNCSNRILFVDNETKEEPIVVPGGLTIAFSSPEVQRYREYRKLSGFIELILNPLEPHDVENIFNQNQHDLSRYKTSSLLASGRNPDSYAASLEEVRENVNVIGCVPRFALKSKKTCLDLVHTACFYKFEELRKEYVISGGSLTGIDDNYSFRVIHILSSDNKNREHGFATEYVLLLLLAIHEGGSYRLLIDHIMNGTSSTSSGFLFENLCHSIFSQKVKGHNFMSNLSHLCCFTQVCSRLFKNETHQLGGREIPSKFFVFDSSIKLSIDNHKKIKRGIYYRASSNQESFDAFTIIEDNVYFFQFTLGNKHDISGFGLYDIVKSTSVSFKSNLKYHLIFVGLDQSLHFSNFTHQKISMSKSVQAKNAKKYLDDDNIKSDPPMKDGITAETKVQLTLKSNALPEISQYKLGLNVDRSVPKWDINLVSNFYKT